MKNYTIVLNTNAVPFQTGCFVKAGKIKANSHKEAAKKYKEFFYGDSYMETFIDFTSIDQNTPFKTILNR